MVSSRGVKVQTKKRSFIQGLLIAASFGFVFFAGLQIGSGQWSLSFSNQAIQSNKNLPNRLDYSSVDKVYDDLKRKFDGELNEEALINGLKRGLVEAAGDPYTVFFDPEEAQSFNEDLTGTFSGIGAELSKEDNLIVVVAPISGSPAEAAGLRAQDVIIAIDGQDTTGISVAEAVKRIRGEKGTQVSLTVVRNNETKEITITRDTITVPSVETSYEQNGQIGVITISRFSEDTSGLVNSAVQEFKSKGVKGVIVDLRNNPGGYLESSVDVSSHWLNKGATILEEKRDGKTVKSYTSPRQGELLGVPTVVLINEGSASASEIMAGALNDNNAATLVGVTTFGKGSVQETVQYDKGGLLKVTVARWYTPNGNNIDESGIEPEVKVEFTEEDIANKNDPQKNKAIEILNQ
jgi:carboxyl-terminal processing protease